MKALEQMLPGINEQVNDQGDASPLGLRVWSTDTMWCVHGAPRLALVSHLLKGIGRREALPFTKAQALPGANQGPGRRQKLWFPWQQRQRHLLSATISWGWDVGCIPLDPDRALFSFSHKEPTLLVLVPKLQSCLWGYFRSGGREWMSLGVGGLGQ